MNLIKRNGDLNLTPPEPGRTRFWFKPSANSRPGVFVIPQDAMDKLTEAQLQHEAVNDPDVMATSLELIIDILVRLYNDVTPADLPKGWLPRSWRYRWYRQGIYRALEALCADDYVNKP